MRVLRTTLAVVCCFAPACGLRLAPLAPALRGTYVARYGMPTMQLWAGRKRSRYEDDGSRLQGADSIGSVDEKLKGGWFSNFKFGTEVEVQGTETKKKGAKKGMRGMAADNSDRGLGGNQAYRNTESARVMGADKGQLIRKAKLEAYINSEEEASDGTFGKIISGSALLSIFGGLVGIYLYYGGDGLLQATAKQRAIESTRQAGVEVCASVDCLPGQ